ncbi:hypothetical protein D3C78_1769370 [compost metagenome]
MRSGSGISDQQAIAGQGAGGLEFRLRRGLFDGGRILNFYQVILLLAKTDTGCRNDAVEHSRSIWDHSDEAAGFCEKA